MDKTMDKTDAAINERLAREVMGAHLRDLPCDMFAPEGFISRWREDATVSCWVTKQGIVSIAHKWNPLANVAQMEMCWNKAVEELGWSITYHGRPKLTPRHEFIIFKDAITVRHGGNHKARVGREAMIAALDAEKEAQCSEK